MKIKNLVFGFLMLFLLSCGGSGTYEEPLVYIGNSRIIVEGVLINKNGSPIRNQEVRMSASNNVDVGKTQTDNAGRFFLSAPRANYSYTLTVSNFNIISSDFFINKLQADNNDVPNFRPTFFALQGSYYNFGTIKINIL